MRRLLLLIFIIVTTFNFAFSEINLVRPKNIIVYFGAPSLINGSRNEIPRAVTEFARYKYIVFGDTIEYATHEQYKNSVEVISELSSLSKIMFGYVNTEINSMDNGVEAITFKIDLWKKMGVTGIYLDNFGYNNGSDRERQNMILDYVHNSGMDACISSIKPEDVFGVIKSPYNRQGLRPKILPSDYYMIEGFGIKDGDFVDADEIKRVLFKTREYSKHYKFKILATTTNDERNLYFENKFYYAWYLSLIYGIEAVGWGEYLYAADRNSAMFRRRPMDDIGRKMISGFAEESDISYLETETGKVFVNIESREYGIIKNSKK